MFSFSIISTPASASRPITFSQAFNISLSTLVILVVIGLLGWLAALFLRTFSGVFLPLAVGAVAALAQAASAEAPTGTKVWFFSDSNGVQQGPFDTVSMKQWFEQNYFLPTTLMRRADQPAGTPGEAWRALEQLGAQPFGRSW